MKIPEYGVAVGGIVAFAVGIGVADGTGVGVTKAWLMIWQHPLIDSERQTIQIKHKILAFISISQMAYHCCFSGLSFVLNGYGDLYILII